MSANYEAASNELLASAIAFYEPLITSKFGTRGVKVIISIYNHPTRENIDYEGTGKDEKQATRAAFINACKGQGVTLS